MSQIALIVLGIFFSFEVNAYEVDLEASASYRSYPYGGSINGVVGVKEIVWGEAGGKDEKFPSPWHGYVRGFLEADIVPSFLKYGTGLELFPLGFLGIRYSNSFMSNHDAYEDYDCNLYRCTGDMYEKLLEYEVKGGVPWLFVVYQTGSMEFSPKSPSSLAMIQPEYGLRVNGGSEDFEKERTIVGSEFMDNYFAYYMVNKLRSEAAGGGDKSTVDYIAGAHKWDKYTVALGIGNFKSNVLDKKTSFFVRGTYTFK